MISGAHTILYSRDAEATRAFFRDVLGLESVDAGGGWLIFALPPGELACHPAAAPDAGQAELFLMCRDLEATRRELEARGVELAAPVSEARYGLMTRIRVPGYGDLGLYQPRHPSPLPGFD
jgi:catechol 2,3-dioxygenase-like lactoylglutathione lyase family enzyme